MFPKINTPEKFIKYLVKLLSEDGRFVPQLADKDFDFNSDEMAVFGQDHTETFCFRVQQVEDDIDV